MSLVFREEPKMQKPTVHINGSSRSDLQAQFEGAYRALGEVIDVMKKATPNARDYYVEGPEAFIRARDEHFERIKKVRELREEYLELFESTE
jgi:hypothetical protein